MNKELLLSAISVDAPSDRPCWEVNPLLWRLFCESYRGKAGWGPGHHSLYTEAFCVQWFDRDER